MAEKIFEMEELGPRDVSKCLLWRKYAQEHPHEKVYVKHTDAARHVYTMRVFTDINLEEFMEQYDETFQHLIHSPAESLAAGVR